MRIEVLFFEGCPHVEATLARIREVLAGLELPAAEVGIETVAVPDAEEAARQRFPGSPTVRIDGADIDPQAEAPKDAALGCRLYGGSGVPPRALLEAALRAARAPI